MDANSFVNKDVIALVACDVYSQDNYDSSFKFAVDTVDPGTDLGICQTVMPTSFAFGLANENYLFFPAPATPLGRNGNITGPFAVVYTQGGFSADGNIINDTGGGTTSPFLSGIGTQIDVLIWIFVALAVVLVFLFVYFNFIRKK